MSTRRVRRLRVRAEDEDDARRAATLLTDALRTASLPLIDQGRLVVIRRLPLGRISVRVSAASLGLQIERVLGEIAWQAVAHDLPAAAEANAVVFANRGDAIIALARRYARGAPTDEWFWSDVVCGWRADLSYEQGWRLILDAAHGVPEAAIVAAAVVAEAIGSGVEDALLSAVPAGQGARWLRMEGWTSVELVSEVSRGRDVLPRRHLRIIDRWRSRWGSTDDRLIWMTTTLAVGDNPAVMADSHLPSRIAGSLRLAVEGETPRESATNPRVSGENALERVRPDLAVDRLPNPLEQWLPSCSDTTEAREDRTDRSVIAGQAAREAAAGSDTAAADARRDPPRAELHFDVEPERAARKQLSGQYTPHAGLLFLVPIFDRLGFAAFLDANPEMSAIDFSARLISFVGQRVGLRPDDPLAIEFHREPPDPDASFELEERLVVWTNTVRRWCRREARQGLHALIRRPGRVHISRTHLDVCFDLSQIDVRLRRLALDVDPGWVPWMGRVVQFIYLDRNEHSF